MNAHSVPGAMREAPAKGLELPSEKTNAEKGDLD
jgi:hypothetical protein